MFGFLYEKFFILYDFVGNKIVFVWWLFFKISIVLWVFALMVKLCLLMLFYSRKLFLLMLFFLSKMCSLAYLLLFLTRISVIVVCESF